MKSPVKVGQVWRNLKSPVGMQVQIVKVFHVFPESYARCRILDTTDTIKIALSRFSDKKGKMKLEQDI